MTRPSPRLVRQAEPPSSFSPTGRAALAIAKARNWRVFPVWSVDESGACRCRSACGKQAGKHPVTAHGFHDATTAPDQIVAWWSEHPEASVGIATGDGLCVVDIDPAKNGAASHATCVARLGDMGPTLTVRTGSGGLHLYYTTTSHIPCSQGRLGPGVDVRCDGGYVVAPPSLHVSGGRYSWEGDPDAAVAPLLPAWVPAMLPPVRVERASAAYGVTDPASRRQALAWLRDRAPVAVEGEAGSSACMTVMAALRTMGVATADDAVDLCESSGWNARCSPPWDHDGPQGLRRKYSESQAPIGDPPRGRVEHPPHSAVDVLREARGEDVRPPMTEAQVMARVEPPPMTASQAMTRAARLDPDLQCDKNRVPKNTLRNVCIILRTDEMYQPLKWNEMRLAPEIRGEVIGEAQIGMVRESIERQYKFAPGKETTIDALRTVAAERSYHPVRDYLRTLSWDGTRRINRVATELLGAADIPIHHVMVRCFLVSAVARALDPGCKADSVFVLVSKQGVGKGKFFRSLAGKAWYSDTRIDLRNKDAMQQIHAAWIYDWPEVGAITGHAQAEEVKAFCSSDTDTFRAPFDRIVSQHPRTGILVGGSNPRPFLSDPTGSRRFSTVEVNAEAISAARVREWRDDLWAEAVDIYVRHRADLEDVGGDEDRTNPEHRWWLTRAEEEQRAEVAAIHTETDERAPKIQAYADEQIERRGYVRLYDIASQCLQMADKDITRAVSMTLGDVMLSLGYIKRHTALGKVWEKDQTD